MVNAKYPIFRTNPNIEKLYLAFLDGNSETANRLNEILSDEAISKEIDKLLETPLISKMLLNDTFECRRTIHTEPYKSNLIYFVKLSAIRNCLQIFCDSFLQSTGKTTFDEAISSFNLENTVAGIIISFITIVSNSGNEQNSSNTGYPDNNIFPGYPSITS